MTHRLEKVIFMLKTLENHPEEFERFAQQTISVDFFIGLETALEDIFAKELNRE